MRAVIVAIGHRDQVGAVAVVTAADDLTRLHAEIAADLEPAEADAALAAAGLGRIEGDTAWLSTAGLRAAGAGLSADWPARFDAMVEYATGKGWRSADGSHLQAHLVRTTANDKEG